MVVQRAITVSFIHLTLLVNNRLDGTFAGKEGFPKTHLSGGAEGGLRGFNDEFKNLDNDNMNEASIIAFTGGGSSVTYDTSMGKGVSMDLSFGYASDVSGFGFASVEVSYWLPQFGLNSEGSTYGGGADGKQDIGVGSSHGSETTSSFTLQDKDPMDMFDVQILRDPVYNTPVFKTVAGRSWCPHEPGTDASEAFDVSFASEDVVLDLSGLGAAREKKRNVARQQLGDDAKGKCASFFVDVDNLTPYVDDLDLRIDIMPIKEYVRRASRENENEERCDEYYCCYAEEPTRSEASSVMLRRGAKHRVSCCASSLRSSSYAPRIIATLRSPREVKRRVICYDEEQSDEFYCPLVASLLVLLLHFVSSLLLVRSACRYRSCS